MKSIKIITMILILIITPIININAQWKNSIDNIGGIVFDFATIGTNIFAGSFGSGVYLSTNNGVNWAKVNSGLKDKGIRSLVVFGTDIYAGTWGGGVFKSNDNGTNWIEVNKGLNNKYVSSLASNNSNIFVGTLGGVYRLTVGDTIWAEINSGLSKKDVTTLGVSDTTIYAGTTDGKVYKSINNGTSWTELITGPSGITALSVNDSIIYVGTGGIDGGVFKSIDGGSNWSKPISVYYVYSIEIKDNYIYIGTNQGIYISTDYGQNWTFTMREDEWTLVRSFLITDLYVYAGYYGGNIKYRLLSEFLGIEIVNDIKINVYPNPAEDFVNIESKKNLKSIKVYNILGNLIANYSEINSGKYILDIRRFKNSVLFLYIQSIDGSTTSYKLLNKNSTPNRVDGTTN